MNEPRNALPIHFHLHQSHRTEVISLGGCGKTPSDEEKRPPGLKPADIPGNLRGPEGPLFHGDARIREFFRNLLEENAGVLMKKITVLSP